MEVFNTIVGIVGVLVGIASLVVGIKALYNTSLIKREQAKEIEAAHDIAIFESYMPRAAIIEKPNQQGTGILLLQLEKYEDLIDYLREHPDEKVITSEYDGKGPYNKVEVAKFGFVGMNDEEI